LVLAVAMLLPRALILKRSDFARWPTYSPIADGTDLCIAGAQDAGFAAGLAVVFLVVLGVFSLRQTALARCVYGSFLLVASICLALTIAHIRVLSMLGRPLNYRWLHYSQFLRSVESQEAVLASTDWKLVAAMVVSAAAYLLVSLVLSARIERRIGVIMRPTFVAAVVTGLMLWSLLGQVEARRRHWDQARLVNPVYYFAQSCIVTAARPTLFTMSAADFQTAGSGHGHSNPLSSAALSKVKHLLVFVLESTPAEYLGLYGSKFGATPNLDRWEKHAAVFENIYAHAPASNKGLFSILCSTYPWISYKSESEEKPDLSRPSIVSELQGRGYATGFFTSGSLEFQKSREFLRARGFDVLEDYKSRRNSRTIFRSERWPFLDGSDDVSTAESLAMWFEQQLHTTRPVFGMLWTNMTHYPYFTQAELHRFGPDENMLNRYLNALHTGDKAFGTVMQSLEAAGIVDETLVVVVGDHGEAFGRHRQFGHAGGIYEENCHVPLVLINPALFRGERYATVGGLVDVAPTVTQILAVPSPREWQGVSLLEGNRPQRTYFFSPWSDYLFGFREGDIKFLYNATRDEYEVYNLARDPEEQQNRIADYQHNTEQSLSALAGWVQHQEQLFRQLID
jgi:arylsulfatase A-like enzyme